MKLVLLPGLDGTGTLFTPLLDYLSHTPVVASYPRDRFLTYAQLTEQVRGMLPPGPFAIVAESFSSPIGIHLASRAQALVLVSGFARFPWGRWLRPLVGPWLFRRLPPPLLRLALLGDAPRSTVDSLVAAVKSVPPAILAERLREVLKVDAREELARCPVPVLHLRGRQDRLLPGGNVPGPHLLLQRHPRECASLIEEFLQALRPPPAEAADP